MAEWIELATERLAVSLAPETGGSIARFDLRHRNATIPVFRSAERDAKTSVEMGCFPLVPFSNRIRGGSFACGERRVELAPNAPGDPSPLHGQGWLASWQLDRVAPSTALMSYRHQAGEWPWDYAAWQDIALDERGLTITLGCRNLSREPMPCGLGLHPFFPCTDETRVDARVQEVWTVEDTVLPIELLPAEGHYALRNKAIDRAGLDNGFEGWDGEARLCWPTHIVQMQSEGCTRLQMFAPPRGGLFAAEPVQHSNCALNAPMDRWTDLGIRMLAHNDERQLTARFDVIA